MPAILIETSFISNPTECKRLVSAKFQDRFSEAVVVGIKNYIKATQSTALYRHPATGRPGKSTLTTWQKSDS
jgi:N-acetylmuramoyl-L-alanine amidase